MDTDIRKAAGEYLHAKRAKSTQRFRPPDRRMLGRIVRLIAYGEIPLAAREYVADLMTYFAGFPGTLFEGSIPDKGAGSGTHRRKSPQTLNAEYRRVAEEYRKQTRKSWKKAADKCFPGGWETFCKSRKVNPLAFDDEGKYIGFESNETPSRFNAWGTDDAFIYLDPAALIIPPVDGDSFATWTPEIPYGWGV